MEPEKGMAWLDRKAGDCVRCRGSYPKDSMIWYVPWWSVFEKTLFCWAR